MQKFFYAFTHPHTRYPSPSRRVPSVDFEVSDRMTAESPFAFALLDDTPVIVAICNKMNQSGYFSLFSSGVFVAKDGGKSRAMGERARTKAGFFAKRTRNYRKGSRRAARMWKRTIHSPFGARSPRKNRLRTSASSSSRILYRAPRDPSRAFLLAVSN